MTDCEMTPEDYDTLVEAGYAGARAMTVHNNHRLANALFDAFQVGSLVDDLGASGTRAAPEPHLSYAFDWAEQRRDWPDGSHGEFKLPSVPAHGALPTDITLKYYARLEVALQKIERLTRQLSMSDSHDVHAGVTLRAYSIAKEALDG